MRVTRSRTAWAFVCVATLVTAACTDPPTTGTGQANVTRGDDGEVVLPECPLDALEQAEGPVEVTFWYGGLGGPTRDTLLDMAERFNASQDKIVVTPSDQGASFQEVYRKVNQAAGSDLSQLPQIFLAEDTTLQQVVDSGLVLPAEACMEADGYDLTNIEPVVRSNYTVGGAFYPGFSLLTSQVLYYNKAHWARAGLDPEDPPETLDELHEAAEALKDAGISERPLSFRVGQTPFRNWLTAVGVDMVNHENGRDDVATEATFDTAEAHDLVDFFRRMNDEGLLNVFSATEGGVNQFLALVQQQSSMLIESSTASTTIAAALQGNLNAEDIGDDFDPESVDLSQLVPGTGPFPGIEAPGGVVPGGGVLYITSTGDPAQQAASWKFMEFMLQPENAVRWHVNGGYLPMVRAVRDDPAVRAFWEQELAGLLLSQGVEQLDQADPDEPGPLIGPFEPYREAVETAVESVLINDADIDDALAGAQEAVTGELECYAG
jgi:sn-glycerol 3-phosphate transport system substrate-binding protein